MTSTTLCNAFTKAGNPCQAPAKRGHDTCRMHLLPPPPECAICLSSMRRRKTTELECKHAFCTRCIRKWIKSNRDTCPSCRSILSVDKLTEVLGRMPDFVLVLETVLPVVELGTPEFEELVKTIAESVYQEIMHSPLARATDHDDQESSTLPAITQYVRRVITPIIRSMNSHSNNDVVATISH